MNLKRLGLILFASGLAGLGILSLLNGDFAMYWQPVPQGIPWRTPLAYLSGAILLLGGVGLFVKRTAAAAAAMLTGFVLLWLILLRAPPLAAHPLDAGDWLGFGENMLLVAGGWLIWLAVRHPADRPLPAWASGDAGVRLGRTFFAAALPLIGLSHFVYLDGTIALVPAWLPFRPGWACLTGAGHMAAGFGILLGIAPRLAATMEAAMITAFVLLLHLPGVASDPGSRLQWTMLCVATAYAGAAWAVAGSPPEARRQPAIRPTG